MATATRLEPSKPPDMTDRERRAALLASLLVDGGNGMPLQISHEGREVLSDLLSTIGLHVTMVEYSMKANDVPVPTGMFSPKDGERISQLGLTIMKESVGLVKIECEMNRVVRW